MAMDGSSESTAAAGRQTLDQARNWFPGLSTAWSLSATCTPAEHQVMGRSVAGWWPQGDQAAPTGLQPAERAAWLAMAMRGRSPADFAVFFGQRFTDGGTVRAGGLELDHQPLGAMSVTGSIVDGKIVYSQAYPATDVLYTVSPTSTEEFLVLHSAKAPTRFTTRIQAAAGKAAVVAITSEANGLVILDAAGHRARIASPYVIDAKGTRSDTAARWLVEGSNDQGWKLTLAPMALS